jgi:uncharacterized protein YqeY
VADRIIGTMSTPQERIENEVKDALKAQDKERLSTLRMLLNAIKNERIRSGEEVDEETFLGLVRKGIKQRRESSDQYRQGNRPELAEKEEREAELLQTYLPPEVDEAEIQAAIREFIESEGLTGPRDMGKVMHEMLHRFAGRADGGTISRLARETLTAKA